VTKSWTIFASRMRHGFIDDQVLKGPTLII